MSKETYAIKIYLGPIAGWDYFRKATNDIHVCTSRIEAELLAYTFGDGALVVEYGSKNKSSSTDTPKFTEVNKQNRTYVFPNFQRVTLNGVVSINVSKSGTHRINTADGKKHIIPSGWLHIEFDADSWTF